MMGDMISYSILRDTIIQAWANCDALFAFSELAMKNVVQSCWDRSYCIIVICRIVTIVPRLAAATCYTLQPRVGRDQIWNQNSFNKIR